jgi:hypothetical protein
VATPTAVIFRGERKVLPSEQDAYVWLIDQFLRYTPDLFTNPKSGPHLCKGRRGADLFAGSNQKMNQPGKLANGWWAELCLSNDQKVRILDAVAQYADLKRGTDWEWQAQGQPTRKFIDTDELLAGLD